MAKADESKSRAIRHRGEGSIYQRASDGRWVGTIELSRVGGKRRRRVLTAKTLAALQRKMKDARKAEESGVLPTNATVEQWMEHWVANIAARKVRPGTLPSYESKSRTWIVPTIGGIKLQQLTPDDVRAVYSAMEKAGASPSLQGHVRAVLRNALNDALADRRILYNPAQVAKPPRRPRQAAHHHKALSVDEAKRVLKAALDIRELVRLMCALVLGMRQGEALGLRWQDVHLDGGEGSSWIGLSEGIRRVPGQGLVRSPVKSERSARRIPLPEPVAVAMREYRAACRTEHLFPGKRDWPMEPGRDWQAWSDALERAGVEHAPLHGARATAASVLRSMGFPDRYIADILGHSQVDLTVQVYERSDEEQRRGALAAYADLLGIGTS